MEIRASRRERSNAYNYSEKSPVLRKSMNRTTLAAWSQISSLSRILTGLPLPPKSISISKYQRATIRLLTMFSSADRNLQLSISSSRHSPLYLYGNIHPFLDPVTLRSQQGRSVQYLLEVSENRRAAQSVRKHIVLYHGCKFPKPLLPNKRSSSVWLTFSASRATTWLALHEYLPTTLEALFNVRRSGQTRMGEMEFT